MKGGKVYCSVYVLIRPDNHLQSVLFVFWFIAQGNRF
jgi:hypothetical protein